MQQLVDAVKAHALANYEKDGWDVIVECWSDNEIEQELVGCETVEQAIARMAHNAKLYDEQRSAVLNEIF